MDNPLLRYHIFPLGDAALTIDFGHYLNKTINNEVIARFNQLNQQPLPGMTEVVPAYSSLTVYYDIMMLKNKTLPDQSVYEWMRQRLEERLLQPVREDQATQKLMRIPVCYDKEFAVDMQSLATKKNIPADEVVQIHTSGIYKVYMLGFLPGFAYMGEVDERIEMPRKSQPVPVAAGSVGIAGKQTGIYPLDSPGGWQIIGRTPLRLFKAPPNHDESGQSLPDREAPGDDENAETRLNFPTLLRAGDRVQFYSIGKNEFEEIKKTGLQQF